MARPFSLCLIVALLIIFAVIEATREQTNQDGQKVQNRGTTRYQNSKLTSESNDFTALTTRSPRNKSFRSETASNLEKNETHFERESSSRSRSKLSRTVDGSAVTSRTNARYLNSSVDNSRNRPKLHTTQASKEKIMKSRHGDNKENVPESQMTKQQTISRRTSLDASSIWIDNAKLDHEVFTKSSDHLRSRTGRKIYTSYNGKELRSQTIPSRKSANENMERGKSPISELEKEKARLEYPRVDITSIANLSKMIDTKNVNDSSNRKEEGIKERDVLLLGSESVLRVDIPLTIGNSENANISTSTTISSVNVSPSQTSRLIKKKIESNDIVELNTKKSKQSDRSRSRSISSANNPETVKSGSIPPRRNSSKFGDTANTGTNGRASNAKRRSNAKNVNSRNRSAHKSRDPNTTEARGNDRNKNVDTNSETSASGQTNTRRNNRRTSEGKRRSKDDRKLKVTEAKIDKQNVGTQSGSSSRSANSFDIITTIPKATIAEATTVSSLGTEIATSSSASATSRSSTVARIFSSTEQVFRSKKRDRKEDPRLKEPPKEDFFNHGLGFRGRKISIEESSSTVANLKTTTLKSETQLPSNPGWTLKRRPNYVNHDIPSTTFASVNRNQINEIILPNDPSRSTEASLSNAKAVRRGTKRPKAKDESNIVSDVASKNVTRGSKTFNKSENFGLPKRIESDRSEESDNYPVAFRARLSQLKNSNSKLTEEKSTTRTSLQATKSSPASLFSERSKLKLDLARRLIKPELNIDENNVTIFDPYSGKSQMKEISTVKEDRIVERTTKATSKLNGAHVSHGSSVIANTQKEKAITRGRWKILEAGKSLKNRNNEALFRSSMIKKNQVSSERTISSSMEETSMSSITKFNTIPRRVTVSHRGTISVEETAATTIDMTMKVQSPTSQSTTVPREETSTLTNMMEISDENNIVTTIEPLKLDKTSIEIIKSDKQERHIDDIQKKTAVTLSTTSIMDRLMESMKTHTTEFAHEITLSPTVTTSSSMHSSMTESKKLYPVYIPDVKKYDSSEDKGRTKFESDANKSVFQPRYTKQQEPDKVAVSMVTSMTIGPTSRYIKKKSGVFTPYDAVPKQFSTEATSTQTKRREFRPRTATYRRHSEVPTSQLMIQPLIKADKEAIASVTISSNDNSSGSNIFNPTRSAFLSSNTTTLLEQLRSTVAPLLNTLSKKTPIFSGAYSNVNTGNSAPRITPNGSPPRFSARYKGAELFVRKPSLDQVVIPSITTSSTTASTPIENSGLAPPVHINNPGEPRFITFYQALESASIRNENLGVNDVSQRQKLTGGVTKVDSNATVPNGVSNDTANNNDTTSPISASIATTSFLDITTIDPDITTAVQSADLSLASRLATEIIPDSTPKITSTTIRIPANPGTSGQTTALIMESSGTNTSDSKITNTLASANVSNTLMLLNVTTTKIVTNEASTNVDVTTDMLPSTESTSDNVRPIESMDTNATTMEITSSSTTMITDISTPASLNLQISINTLDTTTSPTTETVILPEISLEATTMSMMNNLSEKIEMNSVQQYDETTTENIVENIEMNTIQQFDATIPPQMMETTSTTESITTEEISNNIIEIQMTQAPVVTSTFNTRYIDIAQNILSRLQDNFSTARTSIQNPTTTTTSPKLFTTIPDSSSINSKETTTVLETRSGNVGITISPDVDTESAQTTTNRPAQEMSTQNTITLATTLSITHDQSNDQKTNAQDMASSGIIQNARDSSIDTEMATVSRLADFIMKNDSRLSNDTLLSELMTIAKTLFSEEINETQQSLLTPNQIFNVETTINPDVNNFIQTDDMRENDDKNQLVFSNETSETTNMSAELSTLENTSERIDVITFGNETEESSNRGPVGSEISLMELNPRPTDIKNSIDDTTATTIAQGTAVDSRIIQSEQPTETTITSILTTSKFPAVDTTTILSSSIESTTDTATTTSTPTPTTTTTETLQTTESSSRADLATTAVSMFETIASTIDINENLISTETTTIDTRSTMVASTESEKITTIASPIMSATTATTIPYQPTTQINTPDRITPRPAFPSFGVLNMRPYLGSLSGNQATATMPASKFSPSSKAPVRDYQIYGIYPNKTIVRKRPEDNLIDARNVNSPYVIFGIFPDGRLVRKFPNGTIIPDSPRNPVEVVFTLSTTTTTNRPASGPYYNQVNQAGTYNQIQSPVYYNRPVDKLTGGIQSPSPVDFGLIDNAIGVSSGDGSKFAASFGPPASAPCANKMSDILLNTRMNTLPNVASTFDKLQNPIGPSIIPDRERSEASRTKVTADQRSSVYIGQDKFINYQIDGAPDINPKVIDVKINSVATSMNKGTASMTSIPSFENLLSNQSGDGITTPPGFPWRDPLDQIFGITTNSPIQTASVASNQLNELAENNTPIMARPINPLVEIFTPVINGVTTTNPESKPTTGLTSSTTTPSIIPVPTSTNKAAITTTATTTTTITTTTAATTTTTPTTTTTTTTTTTSTTTTPTTTTPTTTTPTMTTPTMTTPTMTTPTTTTPTTTTPTTTTPTTTTIGQTTSSTSIVPQLATIASSKNANILSDKKIRSNIVPSLPTADNILNGLQTNTKENAFGTTFEDLTFLNSLLQNQNSKTTSKTLNEIEQMLANRILALALAKPELTRSPKAIKTVNSNSVLNTIKDLPSSEPSSEPITIDLLAYSSTPPSSVSSSASTAKKYIEVRTTTLASSNNAPITTTRAPVVITAKPKTTMRPKTTTRAPTGLGVSLWRALFGSNLSEASTIASAKKNPKPVTSRSVQTTQKSIEITQQPVQIRKSTTHTSHIMSAIRSHTTPRSVDISDIQVISPKSHADNVDSTSVSTPSSISTQQALLNNPNPRLNDVPTSTYSSEDDAKFLVALLRAIQTETKTSTSTTTHKITEDDEAFLRAILNNKATISTMTPSSTEVNPAALLALLLKQQGIEPSTPAIKVREQLQLASLDLTTTPSMTTTTNRPTSSSSTQFSTRRKTNTPRQSSRPSIRTPGYTWSPSSTYPPPLFGENSGSGLITATRAIGQFLGAAITGAAQQLQSFLRRNGTRSIAG